MPKPIEPSPMTAMRGFADSDMRRFPLLSRDRNSCCDLASGYHGLAALPKRETRRKRGECPERNKNPRGNPPPRPLAVRSRADARLVGRYQREARGWRLAGAV